jgi:hypothetical protein
VRRLLAVIPLVLLAACGPAESSAPAPSTPAVKGELAVLAERVTARRAELKSAKFHTEGFASDGGGTEVRSTADGVVRQDPDGAVGSFAMNIATGGSARKIDLVVLRDGFYAHVDGATMPAGKTWAKYTAQNGGEITSLLRGFGPGSMVGSELDYLQPRAALVLRKAEEQLDGVPVTRYEIAVDTVKMAKLIDDPDIQLQHTQLAQYGVTISAFAWVDATGLPLKAEYRFEQDGKVVKSSSTRFTDWGAPVEIAAPPSAEIIPADQIPK